MLVDLYAQPVDGIRLWKVVEWGERAAALALFVALCPIMLVAGIIVLLLSRKTPLVAHQRAGQYGNPFWVLKLRTMWPGTSQGTDGLVERVIENPVKLKTSADPRVTSRFARFCRRFSIDELPQLINVIRGEMAFVGPRPVTREEMLKYYARHAPEVLAAKPGITGLWQVNGRSRLSYSARRRLDIMLVKNRSVRLYVEILLRTVPAVLCGRDAW